jgi:hypothetical protein
LERRADVNDREWRDLRWYGASPVAADEAMAAWLSDLRARCPWNEMFIDDVSGEYRAVLDALLGPSQTPSSDQRPWPLWRAAREHAAFRRRQGYHAIVLAEAPTVQPMSTVQSAKQEVHRMMVL